MHKEKRKVISRNFSIALVTTIVLALLILTTNTTILARFGGAVNSPQPSSTNVNNQSGSEGGIGGINITSLPPGTTNIIGAATMDGRFITEVMVASVDGRCSLNIPRGTEGLTADLQPLTQISITPVTAPPKPPKCTSIIGLSYNLGPEGATFDPPINISFRYDPNKFPAGINEKNLTIAAYNKATGKWSQLSNIKLDLVTHTISGETGYFTNYSIIAYAAAFSLSSLTISPSKVNIGDIVNISADITNKGDVTDNYNAILIINNKPVSFSQITLAGHTSQIVTFTSTQNEARTYYVKIGTLSGTFKVKRQVSIASPNWFFMQV